MQAAFLISAKGFSEKQVGILFFCFGLSQFLCTAPAGYCLDYSNRKIDWVLSAGVAASALTLLTALTAADGGANMGLMIVWKILQGGITAILPPGFNGITLGIVGSTGFTHQVSRNRMMNHMGTALIVAFGSLLAYVLYPNIGLLFVVSPLAAIGMAYNLRRIKPTHVDRDAARGLIIESPTMNEYDLYDEQEEEAAVAAAALSWQRMEDEDESNGGGDTATKEHHQAEILNQLSNGKAYHRQTSTASCASRMSCPYDNITSACGGASEDQVVAPPVTVPTPQHQEQHPAASVASPAASATSSSYMPPDVVGSNPGGAQLLTSPMPESKEGFIIQAPVTGNAAPSHPTLPVMPASHPMGRSESDGSKAATSRKSYDSGPSFNMGYGTGSVTNVQQPQHPPQHVSPIPSSVPMPSNSGYSQQVYPTQSRCDSKDNGTMSGDGVPRKARTPLAVLMDPTLMMFTAVIFFFHLANSSVLPLVMQSLALEDPQTGILLSGLCILIAQAVMSYFAKVCGDYTPVWGRKNLMLMGLASLTVRCFLLSGLVYSEEVFEEYEGGSNALKALILSTQFLDAVGAGILGCLHILVTNDISGGTGRFSLMLGVTTGTMCLGGTVSGYIGQAIAQDYGYAFAFMALGVISLVPFSLYLFFMPETLPDYARPNQQISKEKRRKRLVALFKKLSEHKKRLVAAAKAHPYGRIKNPNTGSNESTIDSKTQPLQPTQGVSQYPNSYSANGQPKLPAAHVELV